MTTKINFINLKLRSHEEYLNCRTYFVKQNSQNSRLFVSILPKKHPVKVGLEEIEKL